MTPAEQSAFATLRNTLAPLSQRWAAFRVLMTVWFGASYRGESGIDKLLSEVGALVREKEETPYAQD